MSNPFSIPEYTHDRRIAVRVRQKAVPAVKRGHPWLFADSVERCSAEGAPGDTAVLFDPDGKLLGAGLYDPCSAVRVRILAHGPGLPPVGPELFRRLVHEAAQRREGKIPSGTTAWRVLNGESDGFSGLVADRYENVLVMKLYSAAYPSRAGEIAAALAEEYGDLDTVVIRLSRELAGLPEDIRCGLTDGMSFPAGFEGKKIFRENGLRFEADLKTGQKTGFFLDQRDNRARVETLARGRDVLNVFCFSGGFSLYAARGGAKSVTGIDFDRHAIEACERNFELNAAIPAVRACRHTGIRGDAFEEMARLAARKQTFDMVIVDPPSFAKSKADLPAALHSYSALAHAAVKLLRKGSILVFASCSSRATADDVFRTAEEAGGARLEVFDRTYHAPDHPALFAESAYLKCLWAKWK